MNYVERIQAIIELYSYDQKLFEEHGKATDAFLFAGPVDKYFLGVRRGALGYSLITTARSPRGFSKYNLIHDMSIKVDELDYLLSDAQNQSEFEDRIQSFMTIRQALERGH